MPNPPSPTPAAELAALASKPFPNDSAAYRKARTELLADEIELRRQIEKVAAKRRTLPAGGEVPQDYEFVGEDSKRVRLAQMFGDKDTLVTYFWMYGPQRERPCPMCTSFLGSIDVPARDITQRVALAVIGRSPIDRQLAFKRERGWRNLRFHATTSDDFPTDYRGLAPDGSEGAALNVFVKRDGKVQHFWSGEMDGSTADPGQDPRGAPDLAPLWNLLDMTPGGRGDWYPKLEY